MNQVHKVIWSRVKNCYIVVSEITKRIGRDNKASVTGIRPLRALLCAMVIAGCMLPADADAAPGLIHAGTGATASGDSRALLMGIVHKRKKITRLPRAQGRTQRKNMLWLWGIKPQLRGYRALPSADRRTRKARTVSRQARGQKDMRKTV